MASRGTEAARRQDALKTASQFLFTVSYNARDGSVQVLLSLGARNRPAVTRPVSLSDRRSDPDGPKTGLKTSRRPQCVTEACLLVLPVYMPGSTSKA